MIFNKKQLILRPRSPSVSRPQIMCLHNSAQPAAQPRVTRRGEERNGRRGLVGDDRCLRLFRHFLIIYTFVRTVSRALETTTIRTVLYARNPSNRELGRLHITRKIASIDPRIRDTLLEFLLRIKKPKKVHVFPGQLLYTVVPS